MTNTQRLFGFAGAGLSLFVLFAVSSAAIPLYGHYARQFAFSNEDLALTSVIYFIGTLISLIFFARFSDLCGRKASVVFTLLLSAASCACFIYIDSAFLLLLGRFVQGLSCGLASSAVMAYVIDNEPASWEGIGASLSGGAPNFGLAVGAVSSGTAAKYAGGSLSLEFYLLLAALALCLILVSFGGETVRPKIFAVPKKELLKAFIPQIKAPRSIRRLIVPLVCIAVSGWSLGGFYQSYSAAATMRIFHINDSFAASMAFISLIAPIMLGSVISRRWNAKKSRLYGMIFFVVFLAAIYVSLFLDSIALYLFLNACAGTAEGVMFNGSLKDILARTDTADRAGVLSLVYIVSYTGAALPNFLIGKAAHFLDLSQLFLCCLALSVFCCAVLLADAAYAARK